jgi:hypothetical protein
MRYARPASGVRAVAVAVDRPDQTRRPRLVADGRAKLGNEARQRRVGDEGAGPQRLVNLAFCQRPWPRIEEKFEETKHLRSGVDTRSLPGQLSPLPVEHTVPKHETHDGAMSVRTGAGAVNPSIDPPNCCAYS